MSVATCLAANSVWLNSLIYSLSYYCTSSLTQILLMDKLLTPLRRSKVSWENIVITWHTSKTRPMSWVFKDGSRWERAWTMNTVYSRNKRIHKVDKKVLPQWMKCFWAQQNISSLLQNNTNLEKVRPGKSVLMTQHSSSLEICRVMRFQSYQIVIEETQASSSLEIPKWSAEPEQNIQKQILVRISTSRKERTGMKTITHCQSDAPANFCHGELRQFLVVHGCKSGFFDSAPYSLQMTSNEVEWTTEVASKMFRHRTQQFFIFTPDNKDKKAYTQD